jgi:predicted ATP-binding protein involved in virulence
VDYYIRRVLIKGLFEKGNDYKIDLSGGCNCIYGGNGTGKTTIINLIVNSLNGDIEALAPVPFDSLTIQLAKSGQKRPKNFFTLRRIMGEEARVGVVTLKYSIENVKTPPFTIRRGERSDRIGEKYGEVVKVLRNHLLSWVKLTHVPLLRMHDSELYGMQDDRDEYLHSLLRHRRVSQTQIAEIMDPSVKVLNSLQSQFMNEAIETRKKITENLERLKSQLIEKVMIDTDLVSQTSKAFQKISSAVKSKVKDVDVDGYVSKLQEAGIDVPEAKIKEHFSEWKHLNESVKKNYEDMQKSEDDKAPPKIQEAA